MTQQCWEAGCCFAVDPGHWCVPGIICFSLPGAARSSRAGQELCAEQWQCCITGQNLPAPPIHAVSSLYRCSVCLCLRESQPSFVIGFWLQSMRLARASKLPGCSTNPSDPLMFGAHTCFMYSLLRGAPRFFPKTQASPEF